MTRRLPSKSWLLKRINALFAEGKSEDAAKLMAAYSFLRMNPKRLADQLVTSIMVYAAWRDAQVLAAKIGWKG